MYILHTAIVCSSFLLLIGIFYRYGLTITGNLMANTTELLKDNVARFLYVMCVVSFCLLNKFFAWLLLPTVFVLSLTKLAMFKCMEN